jgi:hypothetical protein
MAMDVKGREKSEQLKMPADVFVFAVGFETY